MSYIKKLIAMVLTFAMTLSMASIATIQAMQSPIEFNKSKTYAVISKTNNKAIYVHNINWGNNDTKADGDYTRSGKVLPNSIFKITPLDDQSGADSSKGEVKVNIEYQTVDGKLYPMRSEGNDFIFADPQLRDLNTYIITKTDDNVGTIRDMTRGYYLTVNDQGEIRKLSDDASQATEFTFVENPQLIDNTAYIESVATGKLVTFKNQSDEEYAPISVTGDKENITDNEKFNVGYGTNGDGIKDVVAFQSVSKPGYQIASAKWIDGATPLVGSINRNGGWESIAIEPLGNGQFVLRDAAKGTYVKVNDDNILEAGCEATDEIPDNERFIIHTSQELSEVSHFTFDKSTRTKTSIDLSWDKPLNLYTDIEVYAKASNEVVFNKVTTITNIDHYTVNDLKEGTQYEFYLKFISGNGNLELSDNPVYETKKIKASTRIGEKPQTVTNLKLQQSNNQFTINFDKAKNATHYRILGATSMFGQYTEVATVNTNSAKVNALDSKNKYNNYYKVVALNNGNFGDLDFSNAEEADESEYVSLETELFGRNTFVFSPNDDTTKIDELLNKLFEQQNDYTNDAQFKGNQYQVYFKKGDYTNTSCMYLGFYTTLSGLGKVPTDVKLNNIAIPAYLPAGALGGNGDNATCNFWRSAENLAVYNTGNEQGKAGYGSYRADQLNWAVAQAAPLRRIYSERPIAYDWNYGWASGGYVADSWINASFNDNGNELSAGTFSGQQFYTRNSKLKGNAYGTTLNNFFQGVEASNLPKADGTSGEELLSGQGASNWNIPASDGGQQVFTHIDQTKELAEKSFLYMDDDGEYKVFVPSVQKNTKGISWGEGKDNNGMGAGKSISLDEFYVAKPTDSASDINKALDEGKNIYFTPGTYHAKETIHVKKADTIVLGSGMTSIIPDNDDAAMLVDDVDGVRVAGIIFDAGSHSKYLLKVGKTGSKNSHKDDPTILQDLFFRVGGTTDTLTTADNALEINSHNVLCDHFWIWRADHGTGVAWDGNVSNHGLIVNGDDVTCYALFNEHFNKYDTLWNGENGSTYFYQNEKCYDPISQESWMSHNGSVNGYAAYKVSNNVKKHYAVGLGIYNVFIYTGGTLGENGQPGTLGDGKTVSISMDNAIEVPNNKDVLIENACIQTFANEDGALQKFNSIINGVGSGVSSGITGEGWSRKFLLNYRNGTAVVGKANNSDQKGKYIGVNTIENIKQLGDDDLDLDELKELVNNKKNENLYTEDSYKKYADIYADASKILTTDGLKYSIQKDVDEAVKKLKDAQAQLEIKVNKDELDKLYTDKKDFKEESYTADSWKVFKDALLKAQEVLNNENATQEEVNQAYGALKEATDALKTKTTTPSEEETKGDKLGNTNGQGDNQKGQTTQERNAINRNKSKVKTGDDMKVVPYALLMMAAAGGYVTVCRINKEN
ncbi:fibronectin type III domain-containing protein [Faecalibacillus intestinalis]|uniref:fibronectin type III domain-containing protein n=1 Tax=Faecalibacillus intestinalis TaxID=1982626 RepID=UPI003521AD20